MRRIQPASSALREKQEHWRRDEEDMYSVPTSNAPPWHPLACNYEASRRVGRPGHIIVDLSPAYTVLSLNHYNIYIRGYACWWYH
jgi:hypothetical protein